MSYEPIDTKETYQIDQKGKVIDSILRDVKPDVDENGAFINTAKNKIYIAEQVEKLHGKKAAKAYVEKFKARHDAISGQDGDSEPEAQGEGRNGPDPTTTKKHEYSSEEKIAACQAYFDDHNDATYAEVEKALTSKGIKVNAQHISAGKEAAGLK